MVVLLQREKLDLIACVFLACLRLWNFSSFPDLWFPFIVIIIVIIIPNTLSLAQSSCRLSWNQSHFHLMLSR
jgi:hypothetical protein